MNRILGTAAVSTSLAAAAFGLAGAATAAPVGPPSVTAAVAALQARRYTVIVNRVSTGPLDECQMYSLRPGHTYARMDSGFPGAGNDEITSVTAMTIYLDAGC